MVNCHPPDSGTYRLAEVVVEEVMMRLAGVLGWGWV
jgi:hypothetical protein